MMGASEIFSIAVGWYQEAIQLNKGEINKIRNSSVETIRISFGGLHHPAYALQCTCT